MPSEATNNASKTIDSLLSLFDDEQVFSLPEIQRDFVWKRKSIELLLDSLYKGLPIGSMLVWKPKTAVAARPIHKRGTRPPGQSQERYGYLLDGQQRLTALLLLREEGDEYPLALDAWPEGDGGAFLLAFEEREADTRGRFPCRGGAAGGFRRVGEANR